MPAPLRLAAIGLAHAHILDMSRALVAAGAELLAHHAEADDGAEAAQALAAAFPQARAVADPRAILEDRHIDIVLCAGVPDSRAATAMAAMQHGKDVLIDKPAATTLAQLQALEQVQAQTGRHCAVWFSERLAVRACTRASALVAAGAIGRVVQTVGLGPHRLGAHRRPAWFFERQRHGGILCDIASHQVEQFLHYTGSTEARVLAAQARCLDPVAQPGLQHFGDAMLQGDGGSGYLRVDWLTAPGLPTWGDGRLFILGTEGQIELRKTVDPAGRPGGDHLFLVDREGTRHIDCSTEPLPFAALWLRDVRERSNLALPQAHCFRALRLALQAQALAETADAAHRA
jgi:predicted dehydrogenase